MNKLSAAVLLLAVGAASAQGTNIGMMFVHERTYMSADCGVPGTHELLGSYRPIGCNDGRMYECAGDQILITEFNDPGCSGDIQHQETIMQNTCQRDEHDTRQTRTFTCVAQESIVPPNPEMYASMRAWTDRNCDKEQPGAGSSFSMYYGMKSTDDNPVCIPQEDDGMLHGMMIRCMIGINEVVQVARFQSPNCDPTSQFEIETEAPSETCVWDPNDDRSVVYSCFANFDRMFTGPTGEPLPLRDDDNGHCDNLIQGIRYHPMLGYFIASHCHPSWSSCDMVPPSNELDATMMWYRVPVEISRNMHPRDDCNMHPPVFPSMP